MSGGKKRNLDELEEGRRGGGRHGPKTARTISPWRARKTEKIALQQLGHLAFVDAPQTLFSRCRVPDRKNYLHGKTKNCPTETGTPLPSVDAP